MKTIKDLLKELNACPEAREWAGEMNIEEIVETCHRGDWLLWLASRLRVDKRKLFLAKGHCSNTVRHLMKDSRSIAAVDAAIAFGEGKINEEELKKAADAAYVAADDANYSTYAAYVAAYAAAAYAAYTVAYTASAAAYAASAASIAAAAATAREENHLETADICRKYIGSDIIIKVNYLLTQGGS